MTNMRLYSLVFWYTEMQLKGRNPISNIGSEVFGPSIFIWWILSL